MRTISIFPTSIVFLFLFSSVLYSQNEVLKNHVLFYSSFDGDSKADYSVGDASIYTAKNYKETSNAKPGLQSSDVIIAKHKGLTGDAIQFKKQKTPAIYYNGSKNLGFSSTSWSGSLSFWLKVDLEKELAPGYCDPINITDHKYNDAAIWVDFTKAPERDFRLGVMGDLEVWNPENKNNEVAVKKRTVTVKQPSFSGEKWTHIVITYSEVNTDNSVIKLFLDGQYQGEVKGVNDPFTWEENNAKIMLGLGYIGLIDELAIFDKPLEAKEVKTINELKSGLKPLFQ